MIHDGRAPEQFDDWGQFLACIPVVNRSFVQKNLGYLTDKSRPPEFYRITGGSTAEPIQLPAWKSEILQTAPNAWLGRSWYNIDPEDPMFMIWGHSHLLGSGLRGWINGKVRQIKDCFLGYTRFSAYDLSNDALRNAADALKKSKAAYIYGYSVALDRFAHVNQNADFSDVRLKAVIATAEAFPFADSASRLACLFGVPVAMEYGTIETGVIAHTRPKGGYGIFWFNYFLEALDEGLPGGRILRVTSLYPRCFPLLRYEIGDEVESAKATIGITSFPSVFGRLNDYIELKDGTYIHSEAISHSVKECSLVSAYQMIQKGNDFTLWLIPKIKLNNEEVSKISKRLIKIHSDLAETKIKVTDKLKQTKAGKTPMIIRS